MNVHTQNTNPLTKHVGKYNDKKCVVVLQLPEEPHLVHIVDTESLPQQIHQNLMDIINLPESQAAQWLGDVLNRRMLSDGTNALRSLYERNYVLQVPVTLVTLCPRPNINVPLTEVLGYINQTQIDPLAGQQNPAGVVEDAHAKLIAEEQAKLELGLTQTESPINQHEQNLSGDLYQLNVAKANNLVIEAQMLEAEASRKRAQAAQYTGVAPATPTPPMVVPTVGAQFVDSVTGKAYKNASALKGAITRREKSANG